MQINISRIAAKSLFVATALAATMSAQADATITAIFGNSVGSNGWTATTDNGVTVALRARERLPVPTNNVPSNGAGTYTFSDLNAYSLYGFNNLSTWNFDFSINAGTATVSNYTYQLGLDFNPSANAPSFTVINPMTAFVDNSFGDAGTTTGNGIDATDAASTAGLAAAHSIAQNSENFGWLNAAFDPTVNGTYTIFLAAFDGARQVSRTEITVVVGAGGVLPEPASLALVGVAVLGMAAAGRRRSRKA